MHSLQNLRIGFNAAQEGIARAAKHLANRAALVTMVNDKRGLDCADGTPPALSGRHFLNFGHRQPVVLSQSLALIDSASGLGVFCPPAPQPFVSLFTVAHRVFRASPVRARTTVGSPIAARFGESRQRQGFFAVRAGARIHADTIHQHDRPCHADVLLELLNA